MRRSILVILFIIFLLSHAISSLAAIRCQGALLGTGDTEYALLKACGEPQGRHRISSSGNGGSSGDEVYFYYEQDGRTVQVHLIDGKIVDIDGSIH